MQSLLKLGKLTELDRLTIAETISTIRIFEEGNVEITYRFSEELGALLEGGRGVNPPEGLTLSSELITEKIL
ncbi:MAG: hypothetical protein RRY64_06760 [Oscillospiraceae bacterium]